MVMSLYRQLDKLTIFSAQHYGPWAAKLNLISQAIRKEAKTGIGLKKEIINTLIKEHLENVHEAKDFIDVYLQTRKEVTSESSGFYGDEGC